MYRYTKTFYENIISTGNFFGHLVLLIMRLYWGYAFYLAGSGKLAHVQDTAAFFSAHGIPFPEAMVYIVGGIELVGGCLLMVGFASRLACIPLIIILLTALFTVHYEPVTKVLTNPEIFLAQAPITYLIVTMVVFVFGPGWLSLDFLIETLFFRRKKTDISKEV